MKNLIKSFKERLKVKVEPVSETREAEARRLALQLQTIFTQAPMFKPYQGDFNKIQLDETCINWIQEMLNTSNELITRSEYYQNIQKILHEVLRMNPEGIEVDYITEVSINVKQLYYSLQPQEYWEQKGF